MESRTLLSITSPHPGATAIGQLRGPSAISPMDAVNLSGVQFTAYPRTELNKHQFTVFVENGRVTKGLNGENTRIEVVGEFKFKVKGGSTKPTPNDLTSLETGTLSIRTSSKDKIKLKLTLPTGLTPSENTFNYAVTEAIGGYKGTKGSGELVFGQSLFPSIFLGKDRGVCRAALT
jgi:hypothetical protein